MIVVCEEFYDTLNLLIQDFLARMFSVPTRTVAVRPALRPAEQTTRGVVGTILDNEPAKESTR
jgi:hypothetical protein